MSRTLKDKRWELRWPEDAWDYGVEKINVDLGHRMGVRYLEVAGIKTKKRKNYCHYKWWAKSPSWWVRLTMNRPQRRKARVWEHKVLCQDLEQVDHPLCSRKPHIYYY